MLNPTHLVRRRYPSARAIYRDGAWLIVVPVLGGLRVLARSELGRAAAWWLAAREVEEQRGARAL